MRTRKWLPIFALAGLGLAVARVEAADSTWNTAGGNFTNAGNWTAGIPGASDNALFTNAASYTVTVTVPAETHGAYFGSAGSTVTVSMAGQRWGVNTEAAIATNATADDTVLVSAGQLVVTNATRSAVLNIGLAGKGRLQLSGGNLTADLLLMTNVSDIGYGTNQWLFNANCTAVTYGAEIRIPANGVSYNYSLNIGVSAPGNAEWQILGGTNRVTAFEPGNGVVVGAPWSGANNRLLVSGPGTLLHITNSSPTGAGLTVGSANTYGSSLVVSNGGRILTYGGCGWFVSPCYSNTVTITGTNSTFESGWYWYLYGHHNTVVISNGGCIKSATFSFHQSLAPSNNTVIVTGSGSVFSNTSAGYFNGTNNRFIVTNGAMAYWANGYVPSAGNSCRMIVTDTGSVLNVGTAYVEDDGQIDSLVITNGGYLINRDIVYIAQYANDTGSCVVAGSGSVWTNTGAFYVCVNTGTRANLRVENGGFFTCTAVNMANYDNATGIVTIVGNGSRLQSRAALNMCTAGAGNQAKLRFIADNTGFGQITVAGVMTITAGGKSKLEVDLNNLNVETGPREYVLTTFASKTGSFADADITVTGRYGGVVTQTSTNIVVRVMRPPGMLLMGR